MYISFDNLNSMMETKNLKSQIAYDRSLELIEYCFNKPDLDRANTLFPVEKKSVKRIGNTMFKDMLERNKFDFIITEVMMIVMLSIYYDKHSIINDNVKDDFFDIMMEECYMNDIELYYDEEELGVKLDKYLEDNNKEYEGLLPFLIIGDNIMCLNLKGRL